MNIIEILTAFGAGVLSFLSPCILPLIPGYISFISGASVQEMREPSLDKAISRGVLINTLFFVFGFSLIFVLMGASATFIGRLLTHYNLIFSKIAGVVIALFGLNTMGLLKLNFLSYSKGVQVPRLRVKYISSLLLGIGFAFGWSPCIGPFLAGILIYAGQKETLFKGMFLLSVYSAGLALPFILTSISVNYFFKVFNKIKNYFRFIEFAAGLLLVFIGVLIYFGRLSVLISFMPFIDKLSL